MVVMCSPFVDTPHRVKFSLMDSQLEENEIELPPPPFWTTDEEGALRDSEVIAHLIDKRTIHGRLTHLSAVNEVVVIDSSSLEQELSFTKLHYLAFVKKLPIGQDRHPVEQDCVGAELPSPFQEFSVESFGGNTVSGKTRGSFIDNSGVHLFKAAQKGFVQRLFFPSTTVEHHRIGKLLGEELLDLENSAVKREHIDQALVSQEKEISSTPAIEHAGNKELSPKTSATESQLTDSRRELTKKLGTYLQDMGVVSDEDIHRALARKSGIPFVQLENYRIDRAAVRLISRDIAIRYSLIPLRLVDSKLIVAMEDPFQKEAIDTLQFVTNHHLDLVVATKEDIEEAIGKYYGDDAFEKDIHEAEDVQELVLADTKQEEQVKEQELHSAGKPIVRLVENFMMDAVHKRASDIHIRPLEKTVDLLFRIDGVLFKIRNFNKQLLPAIISRIKIIGQMDIAERRLPQDGQARITDQGNVVDLRISVIPTVNGESAVIRLLNTQVGIKSISQLGFNSRDAELFTNLLNKSNGMILVTGPTGSGKSTTLYAALQTVIQRNLNIITVENPVEYHIDGIEQIQVNTVPGYTFARSLRHILRHDPDVIMIGEIRDEETAKIAVESALTGHLVLSTLHTNDSAGAVTRLLEMGVDPFLINSTILGIFAQRLVRKNCRDCLLEEDAGSIIRKNLGVSDDDVFYKGHGCKQCNDTGYKGRLAVYELLQITSDMHDLIKPGVATQVIHNQAVKDGMVPLTKNALQQARNKLTSLEEVYRVRLEE